MLGKAVDTKEASSGHTIISLTNPTHEKVFLAHQVDFHDEKTLQKLHRQFGHCGSGKLGKLLSSQTTVGKDIMSKIEKIIQSCDICIKYGRAQPKPSVGLPQSIEFNGCVSLDLHQLTQLGKSVWYLHIIDQFSRFSMAKIVYNKRGDEILDAFLMEWVRIFGPPQKLLTDNGREFSNSEFHAFAAMFNVKLITTAAESPWSNGTVERHNAILTETFLKVLDDLKCSPDQALAYSVFAKNSLVNSNGFSPFQIVFNRSANIPTVENSELPGLESIVDSHVVARHINCLHKCRESYIKAETSERIKRAMRTNVRTDKGPFLNGETVFYKRNDDIWRGPGTVIGQDGAVVCIRHAGNVVRVHITRLRRKNQNTAQGLNSTPTIIPDNAQIHQENQSCVSDATLSFDADTDSEKSQLEGKVTEEPDQPSKKALEKADIPAKEVGSNDKLPKVKDKIALKTFKDGHHDVWYEAEIISRAGKVNGRYKNCYNVKFTSPEDVSGQTGCLDFAKDVEEWKPVDNCNEELENGEIENVLLSTGEISEDITQAKLKELDFWASNDIYEITNDNGETSVDTRWVLSVKNGVHKARLVAKGFQDITSSFEKPLNDSPTCAKESIRVVLAILAARLWKPNSLDIKKAFLQGESLKRIVYLKPPPEAKQLGKLWRLKSAFMDSMTPLGIGI